MQARWLQYESTPERGHVPALKQRIGGPIEDWSILYAAEVSHAIVSGAMLCLTL